MSRSIKLWLFALLMICFSAITLFSITSAKPTVPDTRTLSQGVSSKDRCTGNIHSSVKIVIYSDFQCPACAEAHEIFRRIESDYSQKVHFVHRHFPVPQHKNSLLAAVAAEAAGEQGKFFEMREMIFHMQQDWALSSTHGAYLFFLEAASKLGLDVNRFKVDLQRQELRERVLQDVRSGVSSKLQTVPSIFINGTFVQPSSEADLRKKIDAAIKGQ